MSRRVISHAEWMAEGERLFGLPGRNWIFRCPSCGGRQTPREFVEAGMTVEQAQCRAYHSCIGRWVPGRGCDWTLGGFLQLHRTEVEFEGERVPVMEFAPRYALPWPQTAGEAQS